MWHQRCNSEHFLINALSYIAVLVALCMITGDYSAHPKNGSAGVIDQLKEGIVYTWQVVPVRALILLLATFGLGGMAYALLLPVFVKQIGGDANTLGYLMSISATGSLVGTLLLARRTRVAGLGKWIVGSTYLFSAALLALSFAHDFIFAAVTTFFIGASMMVLISATSTILQSIIDENKRGRVMSFFTMAFMGTAPIGSLIGGAIADRFGFNATVLCCSIYCFVISIIFSSKITELRHAAKPLYIQKGLLAAEEEVDILTA